MSSVPVDKRNHLIGFVALMHHPQVRKYTGEPYHMHCRNVAEMAKDKCEFGFEIGMCHDLLEDTECTAEYLHERLVHYGYTGSEAHFITQRVIDLTDVFTHEAFPMLNRNQRKQSEAKRLFEVHPDSQTVKYCDLIDNTSSIVKHDKGFAVKYLTEKKDILAGMNKGNPQMFLKAFQSLRKAQRSLSNE